MFRAAITTAVVATYIWMHASGNNFKDRIKYKILHMDRELTVDAHAKVNAIMHMRKHYSSSPVYHIGKTTCTIRQKYARMIFLYMKSNELYDELPYNIHISHLIEMQQLGWYIDNLVRMLELWTVDEFVKEKQAKIEEQKRKQKAEANKMRWQVQQDTRKIVRQGEEKDEETKKYLNGFDSDFNN